MDKEKQNREEAKAWCEFHQRIMLSNSGCGPMVLAAVVVVVVLALITGCKHVEYVALPQHHTEHHWHTDSIIERDSVVKESLTTIMQLDSAEMAKYGIQLKNAERAWLVKTKELERQIQQLMQLTQTKDSVHDTVLMPYPVIREVNKELSSWQKLRMSVGTIAIIVALASIIGVTAWRIVRKKFLP